MMNISIKKRFRILGFLRWIARILGVLAILLFILFLTGEEFDISRISAAQWTGFLFFPIGVVAGYIVGWKREILGGFISLLSLFCFYAIYGLLISGRLPTGWGFAIFAIPAIFLVACGAYAEVAIGSVKKAEED